MQYVNFNNIPDELKVLDQWVLWKYKVRDGNATKVPFQANGSEAKANDKSTWGAFETIKNSFALGGWQGIGFEFSNDDPYTGIDLDGCRDLETKQIEPWAKELILEFSSYAEISPSQTGVKIWVRGQWNYESGHKMMLPDVRQIGNKKAAIEVYDCGRYFAMTGVRLAGQHHIADRQEQLDAVRKRFWKESVAIRNNSEWRSESSVLDRARSYLQRIPGAISGSDGHGTTFKAACCLSLGFDLPDSDCLNLLSEWNQSCDPPWSERELRHKVESASRLGGERGYLRNASPVRYDSISIPDYKPRQDSVPKIDELHPVKETLLVDAAHAALLHATSGSKLIELGLPDLDYAIGGGVEAGEMIIFAARPSHGKSLGAAQVIHHMTNNGIPCLFISEEMSSRAIGKRTIQFASDVHHSTWQQREHDVKYDLDNHFQSRAECYILEGCRTAARVAHEVKKYVKEKGVGFVVVDYAQILKGIGKTRYESQTNVSETLKHVGQECGVPMVILAQMSRKIEERRPFIPTTADIKETGAFEQDADVIVFQIWPHKLDANVDPKEYHLFIAKNRNREINLNFVQCIFEPSRQRLISDKPTYSGVEDVFDEFANPPGLDLDFGA